MQPSLLVKCLLKGILSQFLSRGVTRSITCLNLALTKKNRCKIWVPGNYAWKRAGSAECEESKFANHAGRQGNGKRKRVTTWT